MKITDLKSDSTNFLIFLVSSALKYVTWACTFCLHVRADMLFSIPNARDVFSPTLAHISMLSEPSQVNRFIFITSLKRAISILGVNLIPLLS